MPALFPLHPVFVPPPALDQESIAHFWRDFPFDFPPNYRSVVEALIGGSPYLRGILAHNLDFACNLIKGDISLEQIYQTLEQARQINARADFMKTMRLCKAHIHLAIALADIGQIWSTQRVLYELSFFADKIIQCSLDWLLCEQQKRGTLQKLRDDNPSADTGYIILSLGKQGAFELNYSSDVDLIILYDPTSPKLTEHIEPERFFVNLTKSLVSLLQDVTQDGYVFRVDLRLRPDPRATQIAMSAPSALVYYESLGQNWERAALIKARASAGDLVAAHQFLAQLQSFIWRKYLDFANISDIKAIKRQIHTLRGHDKIAVLGHDIKLGRGGIREIEFFVQTQQLIAGGRDKNLQGRGTIDMLHALSRAGWISTATALKLQEAYYFLRRVENHLQMVDDEQTHCLPSQQLALARLARFLGFATEQEFSARIIETLIAVQTEYSALFIQEQTLGLSGTNLVFTGAEDDPETLQTLEKLGFKNPGEIAASIRDWHFGRYPILRARRARELLTELMPDILQALSENGDADRTFFAFDHFLKALPTGIQLFSLFQNRPALLRLLATILSTTPRLAEQLSRRPHMFDAVLYPGFFGPLPMLDEISAQLSPAFSDMLEHDLKSVKRFSDKSCDKSNKLERDHCFNEIDPALESQCGLETIADQARILGAEQSFRIAVGLLSENTQGLQAGQAFSDLASFMVNRLYEAVRRSMYEKHGSLHGGRCAILALGKLGGREMTAGSDLDLILIYDHAENAQPSDGAYPLNPSQYYSRFCQRLITALSTPSKEGVLYEVDMRLRPSGGQGPLAVHLQSFATYHHKSAWIWEHLALTRARAIAGDSTLIKMLNTLITTILCTRRDPAQIRTQTLEMRRLIQTTKSFFGIWDLKHAPGGQIDLEFIIQSLQLTHSADYPNILTSNMIDAIDQLGKAGIISTLQMQELRQAYGLYQNISQLLRLCISGPYRPETAPPDLNRLIAHAANCPNLLYVENLLVEAQTTIAELFTLVIGQSMI